MSRLSIETPGKAETVIAGLYRDIERRISASPPGLCPVDMSLSFLRLCLHRPAANVFRAASV